MGGSHWPVTWHLKYKWTQVNNGSGRVRTEAEPKEVANLCLMTNKDENEVSNSNSSEITFNELQDAFDELMSEFKKVGIKNSLFKMMISTISKENEDLQKKKKNLKSEVHVLKEKVKENSSKNSSKEK